jgi:hypothetical protein
MSAEKSPPRANSPNVLAQMGLSTPNLIKAQQHNLRNDEAIFFLTGCNIPSTSAQPNNLKNKQKNPIPQIQELPSQSNFPSNHHIPTPATPTLSIPPSMRQHHPPDISFASSNPTIQPPPNFSPMTNVNELNDIPCFCVPANHPMFTEYFNKQSSPNSPSPDPHNPHHQDQLNHAIDESRLRRQGDKYCRDTATILNAVVCNKIRDCDKLLADGSNFHKWNQRIR